MGMEKTLKEEIYGTEEKLQYWIKRVKNDSRIRPANKRKIIEFYKAMQAKGRSPCRLQIYLDKLKTISAYCDKDLMDMGKKDMEAVFTKLRQGKRKGRDGRPIPCYAPNTIETFKAIIKVFYRWAYNLGKKDKLPPVVLWIESHSVPNGLKKEDLLTIEDIGTLIRTTKNDMHRALIATLYETAGRPGEVLRMQIKDIKWQAHGADILLRGKMEGDNGDRRIPIRNSCDLLRIWLNQHPMKDDPEAPVWVSLKIARNKVLRMPYFIKLIKDIAVQAGLRTYKTAKGNTTSKIYPYIFRHSRGYVLYKQFGEIIAKKFMGHKSDSRMCKIYAHIDDSDVKDAIDLGMGLTQAEEKREDFVCRRCKHPNHYAASFCSKCNTPLDKTLSLEAAFLDETQKEKLQEEKEVRTLLRVLRRNPDILNKLEQIIAQ